MAAVDYATTPTGDSVTMTDADTEYSYALPAGTKHLRFQTADGTAIRFAFETGKVATPTSPYFNLAANAVFDQAHLYLNKQTVYFACASGGKIVEILAWT